MHTVVHTYSGWCTRHTDGTAPPARGLDPPNGKCRISTRQLSPRRGLHDVADGPRRGQLTPRGRPRRTQRVRPRGSTLRQRKTANHITVSDRPRQPPPPPWRAQFVGLLRESNGLRPPAAKSARKGVWATLAQHRSHMHAFRRRLDGYACGGRRGGGCIVDGHTSFAAWTFLGSALVNTPASFFQRQASRRGAVAGRHTHHRTCVHRQRAPP